MGRSEVETPGDLVPVDLRCAHKEGPLSVEIDRARFSWRVAGPGAERRQTAYQVLVGHADEAHSGSAELVWDSRRVESDDPSDVAYAGAPLETAHRYWWKVRVWDEAMRPSSYSAAAVFETALGTDDWEAVLIGLGPNDKPYEPPSGHGPVDHVILAMEPAPYFRCEFVLDKAVQMARLYATALGTYKVSINGPQVLEPRFTFHGFRYAEITGLSGELGQGAITACVVGSDIPRTGYFECSEADVNRLFANIDWSQRDNFLSIPTDCPQRNERLGWLGDAQIFVRTAAYNRDVASFFPNGLTT